MQILQCLSFHFPLTAFQITYQCSYAFNSSFTEMQPAKLDFDMDLVSSNTSRWCLIVMANVMIMISLFANSDLLHPVSDVFALRRSLLASRTAYKLNSPERSKWQRHCTYIVPTLHICFTVFLCFARHIHIHSASKLEY